MKIFILVLVVLCFAKDCIANVINFKFYQDHISLQAKNVTLNSVLTMLQTSTGINFMFDNSIAQDTISIQLDNMETDKGINRILRGYNTFFEYSQNGDIESVHVRAAHSQVTATGPSRYSQSETTKTTEQTALTLTEMMENDSYNKINILKNEKSLVQETIATNELVFIEENTPEMIVNQTTYTIPPGSTEPDSVQPEMEVTEFTGVAPGQP